MAAHAGGSTVYHVAPRVAPVAHGHGNDSDSYLAGRPAVVVGHKTPGGASAPIARPRHITSHPHSTRLPRRTLRLRIVACGQLICRSYHRITHDEKPYHHSLLSHLGCRHSLLPHIPRRAFRRRYRMRSNHRHRCGIHHILQHRPAYEHLYKKKHVGRSKPNTI